MVRDYSSVQAVFPLQAYAITGVSIGDDEFVVAGDQRERFLVGEIFVVADSTGNDGTYTIASVSYASAETTIGVVEDITDATVDGDILHDEIADELGMGLSHDDTADRDAETPDQYAGAHIQRVVNEVRALGRTLGTGIGFAIIDGGGLDILFSSGTIIFGSGAPIDGVPGKLTLADDDISYVEVNASAVVSANTTSFSVGKYPLAIVTTASGDITDIENKRSAIYIAEFGEANLDTFGPEFNPATELTIASGVITRTQGVHRVDTQSDDASDELDTISGGVDGMMLFLRAENDARTVIIKDGSGNIESAGGDITLDNTKQFVQLQYDAALSKWVTVWGADRETLVHALGGAEHSADTLANLNSKISDATLDDPKLPRTRAILNSFRAMEAGGLTIRNMINGFVDEFEDQSGIDAALSVNENYDAGGDFLARGGLAKYEDTGNDSKKMGKTAAGLVPDTEFLGINFDSRDEERLGSAGYGYVDKVGQSFQIDVASTTVKQIQMYFRKVGAPGDITIRIETDAGGVPSGVLAHANLTGTILASAVSGSAAWVSSTFASVGPLSTGTTYWLVAQLSGDPGGSNYFWFTGGDAGYANGKARYKLSTGSWADNLPGMLDYAFKIESDQPEILQLKSAQSFESIDPGNCIATELRIKKTGTPGTITVRIETDSAGEPSGTLVHANATTTISEGDVGATYDWETASFTAFALAASTPYWIVCSLASDPGAGNFYQFNGTLADGYPDGKSMFYDSAWNDDLLVLDKAFRVNVDQATIVSEAYTIAADPAGIFLVIWGDEGTGSITISVSRDGGSTYTAATLDDDGSEQPGGTVKILSDEVDVSGQPSGSSARIKAEIAGDAELHAWGLIGI